VTSLAVGALPDGTPVIVTGSGVWDGMVRVARLADSPLVGEPMAGHDRDVIAVAVGALPDSTQVEESVTGHDGKVTTVAVGALPDGTPVIVTGGADKTVRVWRLADGTQVVPPLCLPGRIASVAVHRKVIVTATGADIAVHQPAIL
jgi:WD40 repeat protein